MTILVMHPGALSTVQDIGRTGYGALGVAPSGAMDLWSFRTANALVGNDDGDAAIEFTMSGPTIAFEDEAVVALSGSPFEASILRSVSGSAFERDVDSSPAPHNATFRLRAPEWGVRRGSRLDPVALLQDAAAETCGDLCRAASEDLIHDDAAADREIPARARERAPDPERLARAQTERRVVWCW